ncbi:MAG: hypothetical protein O3A53_04695 [Acidobacteria bacterium]|nr:hypothetical protein [Acidobacteriota bacterium]MDA1234079.1 hypothetical protein [Acidobacteriota bacterium]
MFQLMRNIHLGIALTVIVMAMIFAASTIFFMYRAWLPDEVTETERSVQVAAGAAATPRELALELIRNHGLKGEVLGIAETDDGYTFRMFRPGTEHSVGYSRVTGAATIKSKQWQIGQTLMQLHTAHGFWHESITATLWSAFSLLTSFGLLLLGASGIYLWFVNRAERLVGGILLTVGLSYGLITLILTRLDS